MTAVDQHTSGAQRQAEREATAEQLAEWDRRLRARVDELAHELGNLAIAATSHNTDAGDHIARGARAAHRELERVSHELREGVPAAPPDRPPFAEDLTATSPPHEDPDLTR